MIDLDINTLRSLATVLMAVAFLGVCLWVFRPNSKRLYDEAASLPFLEESKQSMPSKINQEPQL